MTSEGWLFCSLRTPGRVGLGAALVAIEVSSQDRRGMTMLRSNNPDIELALGAAKLPAKISFVKFGERDPMVEVVEMRGSVHEGRASEFQVKLQVAFKVEVS